MIKKLFPVAAVMMNVVLSATDGVRAQEYLSGIKWKEPPVVTPGKTAADPPSDAVILFDGKDLSAWENGDKWTVKDGVATVGKGDITTKQKFGDCQLHIEWSAPNPPHGHSQGRGNSGVFLQDRYEVQVLDSYHDETYFDGQASAIYKQTPPMVNAMRPPGEWNTYDIIWNAPKFKEDGSLEKPAYVTVLHNGVLTLNHFALQGATPFNQAPKYEAHGKLPIHLQDHGNPVRYRNIWVREIKEPEGTRERPPYFHDHATGKDTPISQSIKVDVPEVSSVEPESGGLPLVFAMKRNKAGQVALYLNENSIDEAGIRKMFDNSKVNKDRAVSLSADRGIPDGEVMKVVNLLESLGLKKLALDTRSANEKLK